jgi:CRP-like cAMP-binding protein
LLLLTLGEAMSPNRTNGTHANALLSKLPASEYQHLEADLELVAMDHGTVLSESGTTSYVYFPTTATVSLQYLLEDGGCPEIAVIGHEGFVADADFFGPHARAHHAVVQNGGMGYRISAQRLQAALNQSNTLMRLVMDCTNHLFYQMAQSIVSSRHQGVFEQVCRRLLLTLDRVQSDTFDMTHEGLANLLHIRRESVTNAAAQLATQGIIKYKRGHITVLNRAGLEAQAGECNPSLRYA